MAIKPRVLVDIKTSRTGPFSLLLERINLSSVKVIRFPLFRYLKGFFLVLAVFYLAFGSVTAPIYSSRSLAAQSDEERRYLEQQLTELESQISDYEATVEGYKKQGKTLQKEIDRLNAEIGKINLQIKAVNLTLKKLDQGIVENTGKIQTIESSIDLNKGALTSAIRKVYESE